MHFRNIPSCFHLASQSIIGGCPKFSVLYVPLLPEISVIHISSFPFHFRLVRRHISRNFRHDFINSASFSHYSVVTFPEVSVIHISSCPLQFRIIRRSYFMIFGLLCISEKFRLVSISLPSPQLPDVRSFLLCMFPYFRIFPPFIFHHFRFISDYSVVIFPEIFRHDFIIPASFSHYSVVVFPEVSVIRISPCSLHFRIIRRSYFMIFGLLCISEKFRLVSISLPSCRMSEVFCFVCSLTSGYFRHSYFIISASFPDYSVVLFPEIPKFRPSYFIISASFPDYSVVLFPEVSVIHISSSPFHFRIIPSFIFHHFRFNSRLFRRPPVLAVRVIFDLGLFSLETETQQYVLLGKNLMETLIKIAIIIITVNIIMRVLLQIKRPWRCMLVVLLVR